PGGYVYVLTGLIMHLDSEAELVGVLSHELAHVTQRHVATRLERAQYTTFASLLLAIAGVALGGSGGGALAVGAMGAGQSAMLNYSRMDESEADQIGLQYMCKAKYPPMGMVDAFKQLRKKSRMSGISIPTYLSTHPAIGDRIASLTARIHHLSSTIRDQPFDNTRFLRVRTLLWARYGDIDAAKHRFTQKNGISQMGLGIMYARNNNIPKAKEAFSNAVHLSPNDALVLREAGAFHFRKGDLSLSRTYLSQALRINPRDYMASYYSALVLNTEGRQQEAISKLHEVLRFVPNEADVHIALAKCLNETGKRCEAYIHMAYSAIYSGNKEKAKQYLNQAKQLVKTSAETKAFKRLESLHEEYLKLWKR
ncbi:MAG: M48 family metalloprotease, partial [Desulfovibrio sp.]|nr:M48 family metalloprotease [Desulfovibrio sp.]